MDTTSDKIDAGLRRALSDEVSRISAVVRFRSPSAERRFPTPAETQALAQRVLSQVAARTGDTAVDYNVFSNMASMVVVGSSPFIKGLVENEDIASATLSGGQVELIRPVAKRSVAKR